MLNAHILYTDGSHGELPLIREETSQGFRLTLPRSLIEKPAETVDMLVDYAPAYEGEDGYIVYDNYMIRFCGHEDQRVDTHYCHMRMLGVKTPRECFVCVVTGLWEQHSFIIQRKDGVYTAHPRFVLDGQPVEADMQVEITYLEGEAADYCGMAKVYQQYQLTRGGCRLLRDRLTDDLRYALDAPEIRIRQGWKPVPTPVEEQTPETEPPMHVAATFDQVGALMDACKAQGVEKAEFCLVGWNISGHDGRWPQAFPVEEKLGGEAALKRLTAKAAEMGYRMVCHTNATDCYSIADRWTDDLPMCTRDGGFQKNKQWGGGRMYNMCPAAGGEAFMIEDLPKVRVLGFKGLHYIDVITCEPPRRCFSEKHPISQREYIAAMRRIAECSRALMGGFQSEGSYDFINDITDMCLYVDFDLLTPPNPLVDENIPMWQLVYHGIVLSNAGPATVNYPVKDWQSRLKFIEYGGHPALYVYSRFHGTNNWMGNDDITCSTPEETQAAAEIIRRVQDEYMPLRDLQMERMIHHCRQGNLTVTAYESGACVVCNYGENGQTYRGEAIAPHEYRLFSC